MYKKIIIILSSFVLSACNFPINDSGSDSNGAERIPATLLQPAHKTVILQDSNNYTDNVSITYPYAENAQITVSSNNPNVLINGKNAVTLFFDQSNFNTPQEIHFSTSLKSVTNVCLGEEFKILYTINNGSNISTQEEAGYIIDKNHSTNFYLNPNGNAPLSVTANIITNEPTTLEYTILNKTSSDISVKKKLNTLANEHDIVIYGLYENHLNYIEVTGRKEDGSLCFSQKVPVKTEKIDIPEKNPDGTIGFVSKIKPEKIDNSWILLQLSRNTRYKVMLDLDGNIRWLLKTLDDALPIKFIKDETSNGNDMVEVSPFYDTAINYYDMAGRLLEDKSITGLYNAHHDSVRLPDDKTVLILANQSGRTTTVDDIVAEYDKVSKTVTNNYDLSKLLPIDRRVNIKQFITDHPKDYLHTNSIDYDNADSGVIISARHQGVFKFDRTFTNVKWIIAPHEGWNGKNIDGITVDLNDKLLTPINMNGEKITDEQVLKGFKADAASGFDWPWAQHNAKILSKDGDILTLIVYDNGDNRQRYGEYPIGTFNPKGYSRAVIYEIDEKNMTIKQIWQAGKELGTNGYSQIMGNAEKLSNNNVYIHSAFVIESDGIKPHTSIFEFDYNDMTTPVYQMILPERDYSYRSYKIKPFDEIK